MTDDRRPSDASRPPASPQTPDMPAAPDAAFPRPWSATPPQPPRPPAGTAARGRGRGPAPGLVYAGVGVRLVAWIIDAVLVGLLSGLAAVGLGITFLTVPGFHGLDLGSLAFWRVDYGAARLTLVIVEAAISGAYFVYGWTRWGATLGQRFLNLQVRNDADGALLTTDQALKRWALLTVPLIGSLPGLGFFVLLYQLYLAWTTSEDPNKQGFHDRQCGTVVVEAT